MVKELVHNPILLAGKAGVHYNRTERVYDGKNREVAEIHR